MGLQSALTTALTGLQAAETTIDVVGNNVANSQTVGFKESEAIFATQFLQTLSIGSAPSPNSGGTNPRQIGLGVKVAEISPNFTQGTIEISSNPLDVAIQGDGFLVVQSDSGDLYTRNGQLKLNSENEIVTATGQRVLGFGVNDNFELQENNENLVPLTIPLGEDRVSLATSSATLAGVLNPTVETGMTQSISESIVLGNGTVPQPQAVPGESFDINDFLEADTPLLTGMSATPANTGTGPGADIVTYRVVFLDASGGAEGAPSADFTVDNSGGAGEIQLNGIPTAPTLGPWTGGRSIYRTEAGGSTFYPVTTILDNTTTDYLDQTADGAAFTTQTELDTELMDPGSYSYYVSYYDSSSQVETRPTARIGTRSIAPPGGKIGIDLSQLDTPTHPDFTFDQIRIYRHPSNDTSQFYRVDDPGNPIPVATASFVDQVSDQNLILNNPIDLNGPAAQEDTLLSDLVVLNGDSYLQNFFEAGTLTFQAEKDGITLTPKSLDISEDPITGTTVLDLMNFIRDVSGIDIDLVENPDATTQPTAGSVSLVDGKIVITSNLGEENAIEVPLTSLQMAPTRSSGTNTVPITFTEIQQADGPGTSTEFVVYDSLGSGLNVRITTVLETKQPNSTTYRWYATSGENEPFPSSGVSTVVGDGLLTFDPHGNLLSTTSNRISIERNITASESPLEVELDFSQVSAKDETDAQNNPISSLNVTNQNGFPPGVLTDFVITEDGTIQGQFSNGTQRTVGQIVMARFANSGGLQQVGDSLFNVGVNSGNAIIGQPGSEGIGTLTSGAIELSNTDIGQNLIELILASTQYRGGARVITATQELLDELLALRR